MLCSSYCSLHQQSQGMFSTSASLCVSIGPSSRSFSTLSSGLDMVSPLFMRIKFGQGSSHVEFPPRQSFARSRFNSAQIAILKSSLINTLPSCPRLVTTMSPKQQLQAALANVDKTTTATLQSRLSVIQANDANITKQTKALQAQTHEARKQQDHWDNLVRAGRNGLKVPFPSHLMANDRTLET
jgi:hypothetical protein